MSDSVGCFLFGFGMAGFANTLILAATFKTLAASLAEMRQTNREGQAILQDMKSEQRRKRENDADYWKYGKLNEEEEEGDDWT